jgi:hypothetical protein
MVSENGAEIIINKKGRGREEWQNKTRQDKTGQARQGQGRRKRRRRPIQLFDSC